MIRCRAEGIIAAPGLDVIAGEPDAHAELLALNNVAALPDFAAATISARAAVARSVVDKLVERSTHASALTPVPEMVAPTVS